MDLNGKTIVITGASRGIGAEAGRAFAEAGARVALIARSEGAIQDLATEIGDSALAVPCDVGDWASVKAAMDRVATHFGPVDVLVNNAGVVEPIAHIGTSDPEAWGKVIDINLKGVYYGCRAVLPAMEAAGQGTILNISSGAAHGPVEAWSHYCTSKAGVFMLTRMLDKEYREKGLRAIGLSPGTVATQMQREIKASGINPVSQLDWEVHIPADWPAKTLVWMCRAEADPWLGQDISLREDEIRRAVGLI